MSSSADAPAPAGAGASARPRWRPRLGVSARGIGAVLALFIMIAVVAPIAVVAISSFWSGAFLRAKGEVTLQNYVNFLTHPETGALMLSTAWITVAASAIAMVTGAVLAWIVARSDIPFRSVAWFLPVTPLLLSGLLRDTAWVGLYSPETGIVNRFLMQLFGLSSPPFDIFSYGGVIITMGLTLAPIPYLILLAPLSSMNPSLEEASRASGSGHLRTLWTVTLPLMRPALLSGFTVSAIIVATSFETPVIIGLPGDVHTFMATIYSTMSNSLNFSQASAQSMVYLALIAVLLWWYRHSTKVEGRFTLVVGRGQMRATTRTGPWRWVLLGVMLAYFVIGFAQLLAAAVYLSLVPYYTVTEAPPPMSFDNYSNALGAVGTVDAITNSITVAAQAAALCVAAALILALVSFKTRFRGRRLAELIGTLPLAFPPLIFSVALLVTFLSVPGLQQFYNTVVLLLIALVVVFLPFALRVVSSSIIGIDDQLIEASSASGARGARTLWSIVIPLLATSIASAAGIVFVLSFRELGAVALVIPRGQNLIMNQIFTMWFSGSYGAVHALNVVAFLITIGVLLVVIGLVRLLRLALNRRADVGTGLPLANARRLVG